MRLALATALWCVLGPDQAGVEPPARSRIPAPPESAPATAPSSSNEVETEAEAEPTGANQDRAQALYEEGRLAYLRGDFGGAIVTFRYLYDLTDDANLLYNIALAYDRLEAYEQAIDYLERYRDSLPSGDPRVRDLDERLAGLRGRLEEQRVRPDRAEDRAEEPPEPPVAEPPRRKVVTAGVIVLGALGAAGIGVGVGLGAASANAKREAERDCASDGSTLLCKGGAQEQLTRSRRFAIGADVSYAVGGVSLAAFATVLTVNLVLRGREDRDPLAGDGARRARTLRLSARGTGLQLAGRF